MKPKLAKPPRASAVKKPAIPKGWRKLRYGEVVHFTDRFFSYIYGWIPYLGGDYPVGPETVFIRRQPRPARSRK